MNRKEAASLLVSGLAITGGVVSAFLTAGATTPTLLILGGGLSALGGLGGNLASNSVQKNLIDKTPPEDVLKNGDLTRAIGKTIFELCGKLAGETADKSDQKSLLKLSKTNLEIWESLILGGDYREGYGLSFNDLDLTEVSSEQSTRYFNAEAGTLDEIKTLDENTWLGIIESLCWKQNCTLSKNTKDRLARKLCDEFAGALRKVLVADFNQDGRAYASMQFRLLVEILNETRRDQEENRALGKKLDALLKRVDEVEWLNDSRFIDLDKEFWKEAFDLNKNIQTIVLATARRVISIDEKIDVLLGLFTDYVKSSKKTAEAPKPLPKHISTQKLTPPEFFTGREDVLKALAATLKREGSAALCGISGLGKSSVVFKYAEDKQDLYAHIVFVRVDRTAFETNLDRAGESLGLTLTPDDDEERRAAKFRARVGEICDAVAAGKRLLLVFDNVDDCGRLRKFIPEHERLDLVLTSNFERVYRLGAKVQIGNLDEAEAMLLLGRVASNEKAKDLDFLTGEDRAAIRAIVARLGFHPLAIAVAGNFMWENKKTFARYLDRLQKSGGRILKDEKGVDAYQHPDIYTAFDLAFNAICDAGNRTEDEQTAAAIARECLKIASALAPDEMPEELFWKTAGKLREDWKTHLEDEDNRDAVYRRLAQYRLFERSGKAETLTIHRLVRLFLAERLKTERANVEEPLAEVLGEHFEFFDFTNREKVERYLAHVGAFLEHLEEKAAADRKRLKIENESTARLCNRYARYYEQSGQYENAEVYYTLFRDICDADTEIDEELTASSCNNLAGLYDSQGRYKEAEPLCEKALEIYKRVFGEDHPHTATSYNNLAGLYYSQGRYEEAEPLLEKALAICKRVLGEDHPDTATNCNNLAGLYYSQGRYEEAEPLLEKALAIHKRVLGEDHPVSATNWDNLAELYRSQGRYEEAEPLYEKALAIRRRILGEDHPNTAQSYNNLAGLYYSQGRYEEAEPLYEKALAIRERILGEDHPDTATNCNNLAELYRSQGRYEEAEPLYEKALAILKRVLGEDHPNTVANNNNLALLYYSQGRYEEAEPLFEKAMAIYKRVLGEDHPATGLSYMNLGAFYYERGRLAEGLEFCEKALRIYEKALPAGHPHIGLCKDWVEEIKKAMA